MAILDRWKRKSVSSGSSSRAQTLSAAIDGEALSKPTSGLAKALAWRPGRRTSTKKAIASQHPDEQGLSELNVRHQELLGSFSMKFGRRRTSTGGYTSYSGISPGNSRHPSVDATNAHGCPPRDEDKFAGEQGGEGGA